MAERLISPAALEIDAVVPQCLDNQYTSDEVFHDMRRRRVDYRDREIAHRRESDFRTEFIRSLVYSSQVVIQRAFLKNSHFLYKNYHPQNGEQLQGFASLVRSKAIVPYLYKETSLNDNLTFDLSKEGDRATRALLAEVGKDVTCVRLAVDERANDQAADSMATEFGSRLTRLAHMSDQPRNAMASELFADPQRLQEEGAWESFDAALDDLAEYSFAAANRIRRKEKRLLTRQDVYRDRFVDRDDDESVVWGHFAQPSRANPYLFELKKYVDLVYNVNLPDQLRRYTFTPVGMPSRMALQDAPAQGYRHEDLSRVVSDTETMDFIRRSFMAQTQRAMTLPSLRNLTVADVVEIRALPEWEPFKEMQAQILKDPLNCLEDLEEFNRHFDRFQRALSDWYNRRYRRPSTEQRYCSFVSLALSLAGKLVIAGSDLGAPEKVLSVFASDRAVDVIPEKVKGYAAKLMVGVYDVGRRQLDRERTYTIELMQTNTELLRDDVVELLEAVSRHDGEGVPDTHAQLADAGTK